MRGMRRRLRGEDGVAAVEFAIVASILLLLVFGIIQFGLALSKIQAFESAARQGGRDAAVAPSTGETAGAIRSDIVNAADPFDITGGASGIGVKVNGVPVPDGAVPCDGVTSTDNWQVQVSWLQAIEIDVPFWKNASINHTIQATFRCEPAAG